MSDFQDLPDRLHSLINLLFEAEAVIRWNQLFKIQFPSTISSWRVRWWGEGEVEVVGAGGRPRPHAASCWSAASRQTEGIKMSFLFLRAVILLCSVVAFV